MTLLYFDGFDLHNNPVFGGLDAGASLMQDAGMYWTGGTITFYRFLDGYEEGRALLVTPGGINTAGGVATGGYRFRSGFWSKMDTDYPVTFTNFTRAELPTAQNLRFTHAGNGQMAIVHGIEGTLAISDEGIINDDEWAYYELYADMTLGVAQFSRNGTLVLDVTDIPIVNSGLTYKLDLGVGSLSAGPDLLIDHYWATDGLYPAGDDVLGVQVSAALDRYDSYQDLFVGSLVLGGSRYVSSTNRPIISSQPSAYSSGENLANVLNFKFNTDPSTGLAWSRTSYNAIEKWGLCYVERQGDKMRVVNLALATLEDNDGMPLVVNRPVDGSGEFSGPWTRTDATKSFSWHIQEIPRDFHELAEDAKSLFIDGEGCAMFTGPAGSVDPDPPTFQAVGLTFAEEFREDYRDFVRVDGAGFSFDSFFISGYSVLGEGNREFQNNYLTVNYENVPTGKAYIQGLWDYSENSSTGRWSMRQSLDNIGGDYMHATRRIKIRGHGKALQIKVTNKGDNPFVINGWTALVTSNTSV